MPSRFKYEIRRKQLTDNNGPIRIQCNNGVPVIVSGIVDTTWLDVTDDIDFKPEFIFNFSDKALDNSKEKGTTGTISISGNTVSFVQEWLNGNACSYLNTMEVRITDMFCGIILPLYEMKADTMKYCEADGCRLELPLREINAPYSCLYTTSIYDDHQGYFNSKDNSTKDHPTFNVCIDSGNAFSTSPRLAFNLLITSFPPAFVGNLVGIDFGLESDKTAREILGLDNFYAAPLVYDIIKNACDKCFLTLDTVFDIGKEYHNVCYYHPQEGRFHKNADDSRKSPSTKFIWGNRTVKAMDTFLDEICQAFNCLWWVENGVLSIKHVTQLNNEPPIIDFNSYPYAPYDVCYEYSGNKYPGSGKYAYIPDPKDGASSEALRRYNDRVSFTKGVANTLFEGVVNKDIPFAATGFFCDRSRDGKHYAEKAFDNAKIVGFVVFAILTLVTASITAGVISAPGAVLLLAILAAWIGAFVFKLETLRDELGCEFYINNIRHIGTGECDVPRLIFWDGVSLNQAKVKVKVGPEIESYYNLDNRSYIDEYSVIEVPNYELFFDANYKDNLYKHHRYSDDTMLNGFTNSVVTYKLPYCCDVLDAFQIYEGGTKRLYFNALLKPYNNWGSLNHITRIRLVPIEGFIEITGKLLRK